MKSLGVTQFLSKKFKLLGIDGIWHETLGYLPQGFIGIVYGDSGNGKTEFLIQLSKYLTQFGRVAWVSYEQRHGYDLQRAVERNQMQEVAGDFIVMDPLARRNDDTTLFENLMREMGRRNSPQFYVIDSYDYIAFSKEEYHELRNRFAHRKGIIFVSHARGRKPKRAVAEYIEYDGGFGIYVKNFIAHVQKNRFSGFEPYIIWEERARELNPVFFEKTTDDGSTSSP